MARKRQPRCEVCDGPARITIQTRERRGMTWLCTTLACQDRYYKLLGKEQSEARK